MCSGNFFIFRPCNFSYLMLQNQLSFDDSNLLLNKVETALQFNKELNIVLQDLKAVSL